MGLKESFFKNLKKGMLEIIQQQKRTGKKLKKQKRNQTVKPKQGTTDITNITDIETSAFEPDKGFVL